MGRKTDRIAELELELAKVSGTNETLEAWRTSWLSGYTDKDAVSLQTTHNAFTELLEHLGVEHMTAAVLRIEALRGIAHRATAQLEQARRITAQKLELTQKLTAQQYDNGVHRMALQQSERERNAAQQAVHDAGFTITNLEARCGELEALLIEIRHGAKHCGWSIGSHIPDRIDAMLDTPE